jgi:hypothetical protein
MRRDWSAPWPQFEDCFEGFESLLRLTKALMNDRPSGERINKGWLQCKCTIQPGQCIAQLPGIEMNEPKDITAHTALSGDIRILHNFG